MLQEKNRLSMWDKVMMAITFAEAGEANTARDILNQRTGKQQQPESRTRKESGKRPDLEQISSIQQKHVAGTR